MTTAVEQVFGIAELLENIISRLFDGSRKGFATAIHCTRVNRFFKATIDGSPKLQRALFFRQHSAEAASQLPHLGYNKFVFKEMVAFLPKHFGVFPDMTRYFTCYVYPLAEGHCTVHFVFEMKPLPEPLKQRWQHGSWEKILVRAGPVQVDYTTVSYGPWGHFKLLLKECNVQDPTFGRLLLEVIADFEPKDFDVQRNEYFIKGFEEGGTQRAITFRRHLVT